MTEFQKAEFEQIVKPILEHPEFIKRKSYKHHGDISVYDHSLAVSRLSYLWAKKCHRDYQSAAIGGLLHDFYDKPWQESQEKKPFFEQHGFVHAYQAMCNAHHYFSKYMNQKIDNIILRHMFPLNIHPPKYMESWMITMVDKYVSLEVFRQPKQVFSWLISTKKRRPRKSVS